MVAHTRRCPISFNGSGSYTANTPGQPVVAQTLIESAVFNALVADLATALSLAILKDGQQTITANIPFAGFSITNGGLRAINGTVGAPGIAFQNDTSSGLYRIGSQNLGISINATKVIDVDASRLLLVQNLLMTDATYDIGTSASVSVTGRPRDLWLSRNLSVPGTAALSNAQLANTGLKLRDTDASHYLIVQPGSNLTADRTLTVTIGDADRTLQLDGNVTIEGVASQAQMEAGLSNQPFVSPGRMHFHPGSVKAWISYNYPGGTPTLQEAYKFSSSITDNGTGDATLNLSFTASSGTFAVSGSVEGGVNTAGISMVARNTSQVRVVTTVAGGVSDTATCIMVCGDI